MDSHDENSGDYDPLSPHRRRIRRELDRFEDEASSRRRRRGIIKLIFGVAILIMGASLGQRFYQFAKDKGRSLARRLPVPDRRPPRKEGKPSYGTQKGPLANEPEYTAYLESIPLVYISAEEIIRPHRNIRNGVKNELPPQHQWKRIKGPLLVADKIRQELGVPLTRIASAFRSYDYNVECGGASRSYHMQNLALDITFACDAMKAARVAKKLRDDGFFTGGIGVYSSFIHIDTRGKNADWGLKITETSQT
ncbi:MAG: D-Ala-D-Ala carboxypeptidase family metallohydrolase [Verrucomicrobiota bacterium]